MGIPRQLQARLDQYEAEAKRPATAPSGDAATATTGAAPADPAAASSGASVAADTSAQDGAQGAQATTQDDADDVSAFQSDASAVRPVGDSADSLFNDPRYRRMEGRYKAQVKRLEDRVSELTEDARGTSVIADLLAQTRSELAELRAEKRGKAQPEAPTEPVVPELTDEEKDMFGDFAPVAEKMIAKSTAPLHAKIAELERQTGAVGQRALQTDETMFVNRVRAQVPAFDSIVNDPDWPEYTKRKVPLTSLTLFDALQDAHNARDLERVSAILNAFASGRAQDPATASTAAASARNAGHVTAATAASATSAPAGASTPPAANGLAQFATPDRTAANPSGKPTPKFRQSDYQARMSDLRGRRITTTEFEQFDKEFQEAKRAGLVA
ncbi:hypothetical protein BTH42_31965 [Burkholderia sp. SRS-W-2-2016]|uniref:hypothetical protein n=1 Tax=Burkholderia sp. SRS-W-2-2016 TaxID=1926878 RepID=UPI00094A9C03|nr:hypothetical protein [Burkholderia sp. SRS-W-2-2016]OLL27464.1 hypothetical protein BTH42_31965 [Burkholderia sp. SRS-W-2-2016]